MVFSMVLILQLNVTLLHSCFFLYRITLSDTKIIHLIQHFCSICGNDNRYKMAILGVAQFSDQNSIKPPVICTVAINIGLVKFIGNLFKSFEIVISLKVTKINQKNGCVCAATALQTDIACDRPPQVLIHDWKGRGEQRTVQLVTICNLTARFYQSLYSVL